MPTPTEPTPVQTSIPTTSERLRLKRHGLTIEKRPGKNGFGTRKFTCVIKFRGQPHYLTLAETAEESFKMAVMGRREIHEGRWEQLREKIQLHRPSGTVLGTVFTWYRQFPADILTHTRETNIRALRNLLVAAGLALSPEGAEKLHVEVLNGELLWSWKQTLQERYAKLAPDQRSQKLRSANSQLLQARSIFSKPATIWYKREKKLVVPVGLDAFRTEKNFPKVDKSDYRVPPDAVITKTLQALDAPLEGNMLPDLNMRKACWLAIGFGLRAGEAMKARNKDFVTVAGDVFFRPDWRAKNKKIPEIGVQLEAWARLAPWIEEKDPEAYVLQGNDTERTGDVFRRISAWMRSLGWQTTHHMHELRAWAGGQIATLHSQGLLAAQCFMRHAGYATTQKFYGHHLKIRLDKVKLTIPAPGRT